MPCCEGGLLWRGRRLPMLLPPLSSPASPRRPPLHPVLHSPHPLPPLASAPPSAAAAIDTAATKGVFHRNGAARRKARLMRDLNAVSAN